MRQKILSLVFLLPFVCFSQSTEPVQVEIQASLCNVDESTIVANLNLNPRFDGWILHYDTSNGDYEKNNITARLRIRSEFDEDTLTYEPKKPEATMKIRSFGSWDEDAKQEVLQNIPENDEAKVEVDLYVNHTELDLDPTLSITHKLGKNQTTFTSERVKTWINSHSRACPHAKTSSFDDPFSHEQKNLIGQVYPILNQNELSTTAVFHLKTWRAKQSKAQPYVFDFEKKTLVWPQNREPIYEISTKITLSPDKSFVETVDQLKTIFTDRGLTLCPTIVTARSLMGQR